MLWTEKRGVGTLSGMIETLIVIGVVLLVWAVVALERIVRILKDVHGELWARNNRTNPLY